MEAHANYDGELARLKAKKLRQTKEKIEKEGILDEDDYGRIVPREGVWRIIPNHADGSFYGFDAWTGNFCSLMDVHQVYVDPDDALAGRWCYFMSKMRPNKWNPDYPYDYLRERIERYDIIHGIGDGAHFAPDYEMGRQDRPLSGGQRHGRTAALLRPARAGDPEHSGVDSPPYRRSPAAGCRRARRTPPAEPAGDGPDQ